MAPIFLAIDLGTEGVRTAVFSADGRSLASSRRRYETHFPSPGWAEQDPAHWWSATNEAVLETIAAAGVVEIEGISVSTTASSVVFLDSDDNPVRPALLWMDTRASSEAAETAESNHPNLALCGGRDSPEWLIPKAMWLKKHEPENFKRSAKIGEAVDFITLQLTGKWVGSQLNATCKWNYDPREGALPNDLYGTLGVPELGDKLPSQIAPVGTPVASLSPSLISWWGLTNAPMVVTGGIDAHVALVGLQGLSQNAVSIAAGTSNAFITETDSAFFSPSIWGPYPSALTEGRWLAEGGQLSAGSAISWVSQKLLGYSRENMQALNLNAEKFSRNGHSLIVLDDFMGNRTPFRDAAMRGGILGLSLGTSGEQIYAAMVESVAFGTRQVVDSFSEAGISVDYLCFHGGIASNGFWLRTTANVLGRPIFSIGSENLTLLGTAAAAAVGLGCFQTFADAAEMFKPTIQTVEPDLTHHGALVERFGIYEQAKVRNQNLFSSLPTANRWQQ